MNAISPLYRNDPEDGLDQKTKEYLDKHFFHQLPHVDVVNPKVLVVFAGGNAVGKSTLSERLSNELHGLRIENDGIKRTLLQERPELAHTDELHQITWQYTMDLYKRLHTMTTNGLVIRDGIITWYYDRILPIFEQQGYSVFTVGYDLSEARIRELIKNRGDTDTSTEQRFYDLIPDQKIHLKRFFEHYTADIMLTDKTVFDHDSVIVALKEKMRSITL